MTLLALCQIFAFLSISYAIALPTASLAPQKSVANIPKRIPKLRYLNDVRSLKQLVNQVPQSYSIYVLYCGTKNQYGYSWCPMCQAMESYIKHLAHYMPEETMLIYVEVGSVEKWHDKDNEFRTACPIKLTTVPTLQNWRTNERLEGYRLFDFARLTKFLDISIERKKSGMASSKT